MTDFDYMNPNYSAIMEQRVKHLRLLQENTHLIVAAREHYRTHPWDFVTDWGVTFEPRNVEKGLITNIPFVLWPKQKEYLEWVYKSWRESRRGLVEKSRDCGVTWLTVGIYCALWLFEDGFTGGFGSRKEELVDKSGDSKCIFEKVRFFIRNTPAIWMPTKFNWREHSAHMRIVNPNTDAAIIGESGDEIGRGGRCSIYGVDEAAFIERQEKVDAALSQNTNCQIDISTPNGNGNLFYRKRQRFNNTDRIFIFDWSDDPRKDKAWYDKQCEEQDEVTVAQEIDRDYNASAEDAFIPAKWVKAAIDSHKTLGFSGEGLRVTGFDPADVGDAKAIINRHGSIVCEADQIKKGDITVALPWAYSQAEQFHADILKYDGDGMGAPVMKTDLAHRKNLRMFILAYHGTAKVEDPDLKYGGDDIEDQDLKFNVDIFYNYRAQTWTWVRDRFEATYKAVERAKTSSLINVNPDDLISIDSDCKCLHELVAELSRPKRVYSKNGKVLVESKIEMRKRGVDSPNLADSLVIAYSAKRPPVKKRLKMKFKNHKIKDRGVGY